MRDLALEGQDAAGLAVLGYLGIPLGLGEGGAVESLHRLVRRDGGVEVSLPGGRVSLLLLRTSFGRGFRDALFLAVVFLDISGGSGWAEFGRSGFRNFGKLTNLIFCADVNFSPQCSHSALLS